MDGGNYPHVELGESDGLHAVSYTHLSWSAPWPAASKTMRESRTRFFEHQRILRMHRNSVNARAGGIPGPEPDAGMAAVLLLRV